MEPPANADRTYGSLQFDGEKDSYVITGEPVVLELAKRVFPGCNTPRSGKVRFPATRRLVGELNWLLLRYPLKIECAEQFAKHRVQAIAHAERRAINQRVEPVTPPASFRGELFPYQKEGVAFLAANEHALLADEMGLGKTVTTLAALSSVNAFPVLIVVPANVQLQWQRMVGTFLNMPAPGQRALTPTEQSPEARGRALCHIIKGLKPYTLPKVPVHIVHYGILRGWRNVLPERGYKAVVFDEIQELRRKESEKYSVASLLGASAKYTWGLSGTPIYNYGSEMWSILNILEYHALGDYESFTREWCTGYLEKRVADPELLGRYLNEEGLMLRRRKSDVQGQLPPKRRVVEVIDSDESRYNALIAEAVQLAHAYDGIKGWTERGQAMRRIDETVRKATGEAKAPYAASFTAALLDAGERVLVYAYHHDVHDTIAEALKLYQPVRITGRETPAEKQAAVEAFADGKTNVVLLSLRSTAGLDRLQGRGTCVVFAELDWSPAVHAQAEDRLHRIGVDASLDSILCYYLVAERGSDETMQAALGLKIGQFIGVMGDKSESEEDRALANQTAEKHLTKILEKLRATQNPRGQTPEASA